VAALNEHGFLALDPRRGWGRPHRIDLHAGTEFVKVALARQTERGEPPTRPICESPSSQALELDGSIQIDVCDGSGESLLEWGADCGVVFRNNTIAFGNVRDGTVRWPDWQSLDDLRGQTIPLRFRLDGSRLYSFAGAA
jgi:hypothetical protein